MTTPQQEAVTVALIKAGFDDEPGDHPLMSETAIEALRDVARTNEGRQCIANLLRNYRFRTDDLTLDERVDAVIDAILGPKAEA